MFGMKKKERGKKKHRISEFFHKQEGKRPFNNLTRNRIVREGVFFKLRLNSSDPCLSKFKHFEYL